MTSDKKRKRIQAINNFAFESFVRTNLAPDIAEVLLYGLGIRSFNGFLRCENLREELLAVHGSIDEKTKPHVFIYNNTLSPPLPIDVKPGIIREIEVFKEECKKYFNNESNEASSGHSSSTQLENELCQSQKRSKGNYDIHRSIMLDAQFNDTNEISKLKYRQKPNTNENNMTDWSFDQEELINYGTKSDDLKVSDDLITKEVTHIYVSHQKIHHFYQTKMKIKAEDIQKFVFLVQNGLAWHMEHLYEFTLKIRTKKPIFEYFINKFENYHFESDDNINQKVKWLIDFVKEIGHKPSGYKQ